MLAEQRVGLVLQIDPHAVDAGGAADDDGDGKEEDEEERLAALLGTVSKRGCGVWPIDDDGDETEEAAAPSIAWDAVRRLVAFEYEEEEEGLRHYWYYGWRDFTVPPSGDDALILELAEEAAATIRCVRMHMCVDQNDIGTVSTRHPHTTGRGARWWWPATAGGGGRARWVPSSRAC
jgi:hypothetical protein